jgi:hypothetical protein
VVLTGGIRVSVIPISLIQQGRLSFSYTMIGLIGILLFMNAKEEELLGILGNTKENQGFEAR